MDKEKNTDLVKIDSSILKKVNNQLEITNRLVAQSTERIEKSKFLKPLIIEGNKTTPSIYFDATQGIIEIKGRSTIHMLSIPISAAEFYQPLLDWLDQYRWLDQSLRKPLKQINVIVRCEYFNTCSGIDLLLIFKKLEAIHKQNNQVVINWFYPEEDEDMLEAGEDYASIIRVPFKMISYKGVKDSLNNTVQEIN